MVATKKKKTEYRELSPFDQLINRLKSREEHLSFSSFNRFCDSPRHFIEYKLEDREETRAMLEGKVLHHAVLEPDTFDEKYAVEPQDTPSSKNQAGFAEAVAAGDAPVDAYASNYSCRGKSAEKMTSEASTLCDSLCKYIDFLKSVNGRKVIPKAMYDFAKTASDHLWKNSASRYVLSEVGETEKPVEWDFSGFHWKGIIDGIGQHVRMDLKLVPDASPRRARWTIENSRYHWQVGNFYGLPDRCGGDRESYIICIDRGFHVSVHKIRKSVIHNNWNEIRYRLTALKRCIFLNEWRKSYDFWKSDGIYEI